MVTDPSNGRHCVRCHHKRPVLSGLFRGGGDVCENPASFKGGSVDIVTGRDGREWSSCHTMRYLGPCGIEGRLFNSPVMSAHKETNDAEVS